MSDRLRKWVVGSMLLGAMAFAGAPGAQAQYRRDPHDRRYTYDYWSGTRWDDRYYQREIRILQDRIWRDKEQLRFDIRRFGKRSFQVRADREQLRRDERTLKQLRADMKRDRRLSQRRNFRGRW
jgi:hypothetical protein